MDSNTNDVDALNKKGLALIDLNRYDEALEQFDGVLELETADVPARNYRGIILDKLERYDENKKL